MNRAKLAFLVVGFLWLAGPIGITSGAPPLLQLSDLKYEGAFRMPSGTHGGSSFSWAGYGLAYNPEHNSLFITGHDWDQMVAEVSIPQLRQSPSLDGLETAAVLQPFVDPTEGQLSTLVSMAKVGGLLVYQNNLYETVYGYYAEGANQVLSHFISPLTLNINGDVRGPYQVGTLGASFYDGYLGLVPSTWQSEFGPVVTGQCCLSIISRTSFGPALFAINPADLGVTNPVPAIPLVYYPSDHPLSAWDSTGPYFNGSTEVTGVVIPEGTRSVLFFGRHGVGTYCYGYGGTNCPSDPKQCYDPVYGECGGGYGTHAYPYKYQIWAYDVQDLVAAKNGQKQPWDVKPYAVWNFDFPYAGEEKRIGGAAYDPSTNRIYITQQNVGNEKITVIQVFKVESGGTPADTTPPAAPTRLRIQ